MARVVRQTVIVRGLLLFAAAAAGCKFGTLPDRTEFVLEISSNVAIPEQMDAVAVHVARADGLIMVDRTDAIGDGPNQVRLPLVLTLVPVEKRYEAFKVRVEGLLRGETVVSRTILTSFVPEKSKLLRMSLAKECLGVACADGLTCGAGGECIDVYIDPVPLPAPTQDAGGQVGASDASEPIKSGVPADGPMTPDTGQSADRLSSESGGSSPEAGEIDGTPDVPFLSSESGTSSPDVRDARGTPDIPLFPSDSAEPDAPPVRDAGGNVDAPVAEEAGSLVDGSSPNDGSVSSLSVAKSGAGGGSVTSSPAGIDCGSACAVDFSTGTVVTLTATADAISTFSGWSGACSGTASCVVSVDTARFVTANFDVVEYGLTVSKSGTGTGSVTSSPGGIVCGGTCAVSFKAAATVTLTANADAGSTFTGWSGDCSGTATCTVTLDAAKSVAANFDQILFGVSVSKTGAGGGTITSSPAGIDCGATCTADFPAGSIVTLTPAADGTSIFAGWSGACTGTGTCTVTVDAIRSAAANFDVAQNGLAVAKTGAGGGTITSSPAGISCGSTCSFNFTAGTVITLTAAADGISMFTGWSGACSGTGTCTVTLAAAKSVTANFDDVQYGLGVARTGTGGGTVTSSPSGINCGSTCSASFTIGIVVTLTAAPGGTSTFTGWSGACSGTGTCTVTVDAAKSVAANFDVIQYGLTVTEAGSGSGVITSSPAGISCGDTCSSSFPTGTVVTLTATADAMSVFAGWADPCSGTASCTVTVDASKSISATFTRVADAGIAPPEAPDASPDAALDTGPVNSCAGMPDFTPCTVVTTPDRHYDICVNGVCVSPGCGDSTCNAPGPHFPFADTSQRLCYDNSGQLTCPASGQAFYGQDGQYGWDSLHAESERFTRNISVANQPVVADNVTGLVWQGCTAGLSGDNCAMVPDGGAAGTYLWQEAVAYCDGLDWGGHQDWHLPDFSELYSLADLGSCAPTIDTAAFPATPSSYFWSSSSTASFSSYAWVVNFDTGYVYGGSIDKNSPSYIRCVRGGATVPTARYTRDTSAANEPVVRDNATGLSWQGCPAGLSGTACDAGSAGKYVWQDALAYCEGLAWAGHSDWRLPNIKEMRSLVNDRLPYLSIDTAVFPATQVEWFWSSSTYACYPTFAWYTSPAPGYVYSSGKSESANSSRVRCVRDGP